MISGAKNDLQSKSSHGLPPEPKIRVTARRSRTAPARPPANFLKLVKDAFNFSSCVLLQMFFVQIEQRYGPVRLLPPGASPGEQRRLFGNFGCRCFHEEEIAAH